MVRIHAIAGAALAAPALACDERIAGSCPVTNSPASEATAPTSATPRKPLNIGAVAHRVRNPVRAAAVRPHVARAPGETKAGLSDSAPAAPPPTPVATRQADASTSGAALAQNQVTEIDLAADAPKAAAQEEANEIDLAADTVTIVPPDNANGTAPAAGAQPPAEESSWLRRILIGIGGILTLASAVRLFTG